MNITRKLFGIFGVALVLMSAPREGTAQVTNITNFFSTANNTSWQVTGGGVTNVIPWELTGQFAGFISVLSGADQGNYLPGISNFDGFWIADYTFTLPYGATNISLSFTNLYIDDRGMVYLNNQFVLATGFADSNILNPGSFVYTDGGTPQTYSSFMPTNAHLSGIIKNGFISGGTNVLQIVINNTGTGTLGPDVAPTNTSTHHDATVLNISGAISYQLGPVVSLIKAVKPSFNFLTVGNSYQLQVSGDLLNWTNVGSAFMATNTTMVYPQYWDVDNWSALSFRLQLSP